MKTEMTMSKLFTTEKLRGLGFTQEREAGFIYLWLELPSGVNLTTPDYEDLGEDIADDEFHRVYVMGENEQLSEKQIKEIIYGEGQ